MTRPHSADTDSPTSHDHAGWRSWLPFIHTHDHLDRMDSALAVSKEGTRAVGLSLVVLLATAGVQAVVVVLTSSVGLFADTIHNGADALTAIPLGLAFVVGRRAPTDRYPYGFGRVEDLAGLAVVAVIAFSAATVIWESVDRLVHPRSVTHLAAVAIAGMVGFVGNELAARYRTRVGRRIGSTALVADGRHARADAVTSLAVMGGALGVALGWRNADPIVGLLIGAAMIVVLWRAARDVFRRLLDATDGTLIARIVELATSSHEVLDVDGTKVRWVGHELHGELALTVDASLTLRDAHRIAEEVRHTLLHEIPRLTAMTIHVDPAVTTDGDDPHGLTAHHLPRLAEADAR